MSEYQKTTISGNGQEFHIHGICSTCGFVEGVAAGCENIVIIRYSLSGLNIKKEEIKRTLTCSFCAKKAQSTIAA